MPPATTAQALGCDQVATAWQQHSLSVTPPSAAHLGLGADASHACLQVEKAGGGGPAVAQRTLQLRHAAIVLGAQQQDPQVQRQQLQRGQGAAAQMKSAEAGAALPCASPAGTLYCWWRHPPCNPPPPCHTASATHRQLALAAGHDAAAGTPLHDGSAQQAHEGHALLAARGGRRRAAVSCSWCLQTRNEEAVCRQTRCTLRPHKGRSSSARMYCVASLSGTGLPSATAHACAPEREGGRQPTGSRLLLRGGLPCNLPVMSCARIPSTAFQATPAHPDPAASAPPGSTCSARTGRPVRQTRSGSVKSSPSTRWPGSRTACGEGCRRLDAHNT